MKVPTKDYLKLVDRFISLANDMKNEGTDVNVIANAAMESSAIYATFVTSGNEGYLQPSGVDKLVDAFRHILTRVQQHRKARAEARRDS